MSDMPRRVEAAQDFLEHVWDAEGRGKFGNRYDADESPPPALNKLESATKDAALEVMRSYFQGEMDFGDVPMYKSRKKKKDAVAKPSKDVAEKERIT